MERNILEDKKNSFLEIEYTVLSSYFIQIISFRFITFGFFITAIGFIFTQDNLNDNQILSFSFLLILTLVVFLIEMRNRTLASTVIERCKNIEEMFLEIRGLENKPFYNLITTEDHTKRLKIKPNFLGVDFPDTKIPTITNLKDYITSRKDMEKSKYLFSHSFAIDIAYTFSFIFCIYKLISLCTN